MIAYLMLLRDLEWKALTRVQRRFAYETCVHPLLTTTIALGAKALLLVAIMYLGAMLGLLGHPSTSLAIIATACFAPSELVDVIVVTRSHATISDFIKEHTSGSSPN